MNHEMTLGQLIAALEAREQTAVVNGFCNPHSYRGYYEELAFEPTANVTVSSMLRCARESVGKTFEGYKGGNYVMHEGVGVWLANYGCTGTIINANYLAIMSIDADVNAAITAKDSEIARLRDALTDMLSGWIYIRQTHGDLYGVGWGRAEEKARAALAGGGA